jgi:hypothetical protein
MCQGIRNSLASAIVVMNDSNGHFTKKDDNYRLALKACRERGQTVIGYVTTGGKKNLRGGRRLLKSVKTEVDRYYQHYPGIRGIFFDEMRNDPDQVGTRPAKRGERRNQRYYKLLYDYVQRKAGRQTVVGNPGVAAGTDWQVKTPVVDILVVFEGPSARVNGDPTEVNGYDTFTPPAWMSRSHYRARRFAHLVYRAERSTTRSICEASATRRAGRIYVTSDDLFPPAETNPWNTPPDPELFACPTLHRADVLAP